MTDTSTAPGPSGGNPWGPEHDDPGYGQVPAFGPSLYRRFYQSYLGDPIGPNQHLTGGAVAVGLTVPDFAMAALVTVTGDFAHFSFDGTPAAAANGLVVPVGSTVKVTGRASLKSLSAFPNSVATVLDVTYWT